jgi:hypothetical protein
MRISPRYSDDDWKALDLAKEEGWQKGIDILEDRIRGRFLDMIARIQSAEFAGFAILALDCLLAETMQQFRDGLSESPSGRGANERFFVKFLRSTRFGRFFDDDQKAIMFYKQIRCGILHQAEVKASSLVVIDPHAPLVRLTDDGKGLVINRWLFHQELAACFDEYVRDLRKQQNAALRQAFKTKMDYICRVPASSP